MKPDVLVVHPLHLIYPLWQYNMVRYKEYFRSLTITFSNHHMERDYSNFIRQQLPFANAVEYKGDKPDWRNGAVNAGLDTMPEDGHVLFMEQDFLFTETFLQKVLKDTYKFIYFTEGERVHPAFALVERKLVNSTNRDFSAYPDTDNKDHFGRFFDELTTGINIDELGVKSRIDYFHLNGLSQNYMSYKNDQPFYNKNDFLTYNNNCRYLPIDNHAEFYQIELAIDRKYSHPETHPFLDRFFPK